MLFIAVGHASLQEVGGDFAATKVRVIQNLQVEGLRGGHAFEPRFLQSALHTGNRFVARGA
jgi:hypothetical protein